MFALLALVLAAVPALSIVTPTSPDGSTVVRVGQNIDALWTADTTGTWNNVTIQLMTGANLNMIPLSTLASGIDGTTVTSWSGPAPDVTPNAAIYFLQFSNGGDMTALTWTTRFTIAGADGSTTQPTDSTPDSTGTPIKWGTGALVNGGSTGTASNGTSGGSASAAASSGGSSSPTSVSSAAHSGVTAYTDGLPSSNTLTSTSLSGSQPSAAVGAASASASPKSGASSTIKTSLGMSGALLLALASSAVAFL